MTQRIHRSIAPTVAALAVVTAVFALIPSLSFGLRAEESHASIETAATIVSLLAMSILYGRVQARTTTFELVLFASLVLLFVANFAGGVAPAYDGTNDAVVWVPLSMTAAAAGGLVAAAFSPDQALARTARAFGLTAVGLAAVGLIAVIIGLLSDQLPTGLEPTLSPADAGTPRVVGTVGFLALQLVAMALFALASVGLVRRARQTHDELLAWLALAAVWAAFARLNYFLFPSIHSEWLFTGDALRFASYLLILVGALRQIAVYQHLSAEAAIAGERDRIARDLHDGVAQDLAFIAMQADELEARDDRAKRIAARARAAMARLRRAISDLQHGDEQ